MTRRLVDPPRPPDGVSRRPCWCGRDELIPFNDDYARCLACETLVLQRETAAAAGRVVDDDADFYGRQYWFEHQRELGHVDFTQRMRSDLTDRGVQWLDTVLRYRQPPAAALEIGCSHGGFVALLRRAGFDAQGLELSPSIARLAAESFGVRVLVGPIEDQTLASGSLDLIVAMDVVEHLVDPVSSFEHYARLLGPKGLLFLQTPCYPEGLDLAALTAAASPFLQMLLPDEHIYLFSRTGLERLAERVGLPHLAFEPAVFPYDMCVVLGRTAITPLSREAATATLSTAPDARIARALVDLGAERDTLRARLEQAERDAHERLVNVTTLERLLIEANAEREARLEQIHELGDLLQEASADGEARLTQIHQLGDLLQEANVDREARLTQIHQLGDLLQEANVDREARLTQIHQLGDLLRDAQAESAARLAHMQTLDQLLVVDTQQLSEARNELERVRAESGGRPAPGASARAHSKPLPLIAIDVTPILPGSENGGAKGFVLTLLEQMAAAGRHRYLLLTSEKNHDSFAAFERPGMTRRLVTAGPDSAPRWRRLIRRVFDRGRRLTGLGPLSQQRVDLLLCPMTDPYYAEPGIPTISIVYDLQHLAYPEFFSAAERGHRDAFFNRVTRSADFIVCISDFTRREVVSRLDIDERRVSAIPVAVHARLPIPSAEQVRAVRDRYGLSDAPFLLFPANGWPHKNHRMLLVAFARVVRERPDLAVRLVLAGNLLAMEGEIRDAVATMGLADRVRLVGFVPDSDLAALWCGAACLVYPTLYEGFGIPLVEAMRYGTPIIASNVASLPEVGGDAARYVDPRRPGDIAAAILEVLAHPTLHHELVVRGAKRLRQFDSSLMVRGYLDAIDRALTTQDHVQGARVEGVFADRWLGPSTVALSGPSPGDRAWTFDLQFPDWLPHERSAVQIHLNGRTSDRLTVARGETRRVVVKVPKKGGHVRLQIQPSFVPGTNDQRELTAMLVRAELSESSGEVVHVV